MANEPTEETGCLSKIALQLIPPSMDLKIPPEAALAKQILGFAGNSNNSYDSVPNRSDVPILDFFEKFRLNILFLLFYLSAPQATLIKAIALSQAGKKFLFHPVTDRRTILCSHIIEKCQRQFSSMDPFFLYHFLFISVFF